LGKLFARPYLKNTYHKKGLVDCLKVESLSSSPTSALHTKNSTHKNGFLLLKMENRIRKYLLSRELLLVGGVRI